MQVPREVHVGSVVIYHPDPKLPEWHDRGHLPSLPAIVVKVWSSGAVNLRVANVDKLDLKVFLDHNAKDRDAFVWVFGATEGGGIGQWEHAKA